MMHKASIVCALKWFPPYIYILIVTKEGDLTLKYILYLVGKNKVMGKKINTILAS